MFHVLEENLFPPRLTHGLERSLSASTFDHVTDSVGIILFSDDYYAIYTDGLERVDLCLYCSLLPCVSLTGALKGVLVHVYLAMVLKELDGWS